MARPVVAIIGSPNVGKSTIFNRVLGHRHSIVDDQAGVTRDRIYSEASWLGVPFSIVDTGGVEIANHTFQTQIREQAQLAINEADVIVFMCDGKLGVTADDKLVAKMLYKVDKPVILAVNKIDEGHLIAELSEFYTLGLGEPLALSGAHGIGVGDLLDKIVSLLPKTEEEDFSDSITFSLIGRPNVGKSSLLNALINQERVIVSNVEGTTRDSIDTHFTRNGKNFVAIDTAGLKKRGQIYEAIDKYAAMRALKAIERSEVVLLVIDAEKGILEQDKHVVGYAIENNKAIVIVVNKWDLISKNEKTMQEYTKKIKDQFVFLDYAPIVFVSALTKSRVAKIFDAIEYAYNAYHLRVQTSLLNEVMQRAQQMNEAPHFNGGRLRIYFANQVDVAPPTFVLFVNDPKYMHFSYERYLLNQLRGTFSFDGTPIKIVLRKRV